MLNRCSIYVHFCEVKSARRAFTNNNWRNNLWSIAVVSMYTFAKSKVRDELLPIVIGEITRARPLPLYAFSITLYLDFFILRYCYD